MPAILELAPLHGITNRVYRNVFARHFPDFDVAMAPFILSVGSATMKETHYKDLVPEYNTRLPIIPQILSGQASDFIDTAKVLVDLGYEEVNWNLGCPYPMVTKKIRGAGLLPHPELVERFLDAVFKTGSVKLSVKLRLGLLDAEEMQTILPVLNAFPLTRIILHPRIATQLYGGEVDLEGFKKALEMSKHRVVYNGDITSLEVFTMLQQRFPSVNEWMIGRGALANPFLPGQIKGKPEPLDAFVSIKKFHDELYTSYREILDGQRHVLDKMKEVWSYLSLSCTNVEHVMKKISRATSFGSYEAAVSSVYSSESWLPR